MTSMPRLLALALLASTSLPAVAVADTDPVGRFFRGALDRHPELRESSRDDWRLAQRWSQRYDDDDDDGRRSSRSRRDDDDDDD